MSSASSSIDLKVSVLTSGFWPGPPGAPCDWPPEVQECCTRFETFYLAKHTGRKLYWQPQHGMADLKASPFTHHSSKELGLGSLGCFWIDLQVRTNIPLDELKRHLLSLYVNPKAKILVRRDSEKEKKDTSVPQASESSCAGLQNDQLQSCLFHFHLHLKDIEDNDQFMVNPHFENKLMRIKVPLVLKSPDTVSAEATKSAANSMGLCFVTRAVPAITDPH
eukprot:g7930.t1